ncbi:MAG: tRNA (adenosine(37)-N6)-dimethylallyltransferase MiaA [Spirochaetaceae bacterium]|nr:tRNA (adenosine(37)-N6)-dimethylallyltransferase MiaA [Spirochaetaceae bacterium]
MTVHRVAAVADVVAIVGATATGKSDLAVALARALDGEVVNADSMQLYRGMDIGSAKLPPDQRGGVPHHLLDVWDVTEPANVAGYQGLAREVFAEVAGRGRTPVLVGGSGLYVRAALDDLDFPGTDDAVRARLDAELAAEGAGALHARLAVVDPRAAAAILPGNGRRIVRALEVVELTGAPFVATLPEPVYAVPGVQLGLAVDRAVLDERISRRVERMWELGLVDEVRSLEDRGLREGRTASQALGYAQVLRHLAGECSEDEAREDTVRATRRFARRQESWFRRDPRVRWLEVSDTGDIGDAGDTDNSAEQGALTERALSALGAMPDN